MNLTILYVEDDLDDCDLFTSAIANISPDIKCVIAFDGDEALAKLIDFPHNPDIIFLDINMPKMDGREFVSELKKNERLCNIPIVVYSTTIGSPDLQFFNQQNVFHFFNKPTDFNVLCKGLQHILARYATRPIHAD